MSTHTTDYIVDALLLRKEGCKALVPIFAHPAVIKIFHGSDTDIQLLVADLAIVTINIFDTARAYQFL